MIVKKEFFKGLLKAAELPDRAWMKAPEPPFSGRDTLGSPAPHEASDLRGLPSGLRFLRAMPPGRPERATGRCPHRGLAPLSTSCDRARSSDRRFWCTNVDPMSSPWQEGGPSRHRRGRPVRASASVRPIGPTTKHAGPAPCLVLLQRLAVAREEPRDAARLARDAVRVEEADRVAVERRAALRREEMRGKRSACGSHTPQANKNKKKVFFI